MSGLTLALGALLGHPLYPFTDAHIINTGGGFQVIHVTVSTGLADAYVLISDAKVNDGWEVGVFPNSGHNGAWPGTTGPKFVPALELLHPAVEEAVAVLSNWPVTAPADTSPAWDQLPAEVQEIILAASDLADCTRGELGYEDPQAACRRLDAALTAFGNHRLYKLQGRPLPATAASALPRPRAPGSDLTLAITGYQLRALAAHYRPILRDKDHVWMHPAPGSAGDEVYDLTTGGVLVDRSPTDTPKVTFPAYPERT
jgi:hypothetical protein